MARDAKRGKALPNLPSICLHDGRSNSAKPAYFAVYISPQRTTPRPSKPPASPDGAAKLPEMVRPLLGLPDVEPPAVGVKEGVSGRFAREPS